MELREGSTYFSDTAVEGMTEFRYVRTCLLTGDHMTNSVWCWSRTDFLELLACWNQRGHSTWKYSE